MTIGISGQVFKIEVLMNGRKHFVEKRYSEFHALHKKLKKFIRTPEIPSKHVRNWVPKVLEQRRQGLEFYLQSIVLENEELPKMFLDFLNVRHFPSLPKAESCGSFEETESEESSKLSHQPVLLFLRDPYVLPAANDDFPNVVIEGILHGLFYPHLQPSDFNNKSTQKERGQKRKIKTLFLYRGIPHFKVVYIQCPFSVKKSTL
ncbi:sorting nexin-24 isoform 2-T2 [Liasis olivaceus]